MPLSLKKTIVKIFLKTASVKIYTETERFILREIVEDDFQDFYELDSDPEVHKYLGNKPVQDIETSKNMVASIRQQYKDVGIARWAIIDKTKQEFLGWGGLKFEQGIAEKGDYYDLGYRIKRKHWGKGIATEVAIAALAYGFETMQLKEICAAAHVENTGSNKILQKIGMLYIDTFHFMNVDVNWYKTTKT